MYLEIPLQLPYKTHQYKLSASKKQAINEPEALGLFIDWAMHHGASSEDARQGIWDEFEWFKCQCSQYNSALSPISRWAMIWIMILTTVSTKRIADGQGHCRKIEMVGIYLAKGRLETTPLYLRLASGKGISRDDSAPLIFRPYIAKTRITQRPSNIGKKDHAPL
jgi:hypothetical protein